jgi:parallel beta-helix repeat protein
MMSIIVLWLFAFEATHSSRMIWYVHPDSSLNSIQTALDSCADNDIVLVGPGKYYENLIWPNTQGIHLISEFGPEMTIIDGDSSGRVITMDLALDTTTVIRGFTIQRGFEASARGGGIYCHSGAAPLITGNDILNNIADWGGAGIYCYRSAPVIRGNLIADNIGGGSGTGQSCGGGIDCFRSSPIVSQNTIVRNKVLDFYGGGIRVLDGSPIINDNIISQNTALYTGGGIECGNASATIINNEIRENSAGVRGGGISVYQDSGTVIIRNTITGNVATYNGGGISLENNCSPLIRRNTITNNTSIESSGAYGAGIYITIFCYPIIDSCIISSNNGSGVYSWCLSSPQVHYCNIENNLGYGVYNNDSLYTIYAEYNWWGDTSGPGGVGPGIGDSVGMFVNYEPWLREPITSIKENSGDRVLVSLHICPNPFRDKIEIKYRIFDRNEGRNIGIYDITGRLVKRFDLPSGQSQHTLTWYGHDDNNQKVPSGVYFLRLETKRHIETRKLILLK